MLAAPSRPAKLPSVAICPAAPRNAPQATRERAEPRLTRRTPSSARSVRSRPMSAPIRTLTGFGAAASTIAATSCAAAGARGVEDVGARFRVGGEPADRLRERLRVAGQEALGPGRQQDVGAARIDRLACGADSLDRRGELVERRSLGRAGRILNRKARRTRLDAAADVRGDAVRVVGVPRLEVDADRQLRRPDDVGDVPEHVVDRERVAGVRQPSGEGEAGAARGEGPEAQRREGAGGPPIPGVGDREAPALVQGAELGTPLCEVRRGHRGRAGRSRCSRRGPSSGRARRGPSSGPSRRRPGRRERGPRCRGGRGRRRRRPGRAP